MGAHLQIHASEHTSGTDDIQSASNSQKGLATAAHISSLETNTSKITTTESRLTTAESKLNTSDTSESKVATLETEMDAVESKNTTQDTRLTAVESKNTTQDTSITARQLITIDSTPDSDTTANGEKVTETAGENLAFGDVCYLKSDGKYWKTDADAAATMPGTLMALGTINADASGSFLRSGYARNDAWNWTVGGLLYADTATAGGLTQTAPSGTGDQVQVIGVARSADIVDFRPSLVLVEVA